MNPAQSINIYLRRHPHLSGLIYVGLIVVCCLMIASALSDLVEGYRAHATSLEMLSRFEGRNQNSPKDRDSKNSHTGSPFLEGQTITLASAALLQRITGIITKSGGTVVSSEIVPQQRQSNDGYVGALANCELEQETLQKVLYEIEEGLPFLFVDQLDVQSSSEPGGRLRVRLGVVGPWLGGK